MYPWACICASCDDIMLMVKRYDEAKLGCFASSSKPTITRTTHKWPFTARISSKVAYLKYQKLVRVAVPAQLNPHKSTYLEFTESTVLTEE